MLMFIGQEGSQAAVFAQKLAKDYLKVGVQVLSESTFIAVLPKMNKNTPIVIEKGATVGKYQDLLLQTIKERDMTIIMMNCNEGDLHNLGVAVSPRGKYIAVKNNANGRRQEVLVLEEGIHEIEYASQSVERALAQRIDKEEDDPSLDEDTTPTADFAAKPPEKTTPGDAEAMQLESLAQFLTEESKPSAEFVDGGTMASSSHYWEFHTRITFQSFSDFSPTHPDAPKWLNDKLKRGFIKAFCTVDVDQYATKTPRQKWIEFKLTDAIGMSCQMGSDYHKARGYFNRSSSIYLYPGNGNDPQRSVLPAGWSRPNAEPHTPNSKTTYTSTTGWSFGVEGGADADGPKADVTASYSQSNEKTTTIYDFSVRNISDGSMSGWNFYYTAVDGNKWKDHFTWNNEVKSIANLAKSTLYMNAEAVYEGPPDTNEKIMFSVKPQFQYAVLRGSAFHKWIYWSDRYLGISHTSIDMGAVKNPEPGYY